MRFAAIATVHNEVRRTSDLLEERANGRVPHETGASMADLPFSAEEVRAALPTCGILAPELGRGAFKVAYRGKDGDQDIVVKILTEPFPEDLEAIETSELPERFARELAGMSRVTSPHVVSLLSPPAIVRIAGASYLWYREPFYPGGTLEAAIAAGRSGRELGDAVLEAMLRAVRDIWVQAAMVHRDIKPGNVVFDSTGGPVLLDLGIAFHSDLTAITDAFGPSPRTPRYAAPEQFEMRRIATIDFRTDLFQVGLVAYESYTGKHPYWYRGIDTAEYMERLESGSVDRVALIQAGCSEENADVITRLVAGRPSGRYRRVEAPLESIRGSAR